MVLVTMLNIMIIIQFYCNYDHYDDFAMMKLVIIDEYHCHVLYPNEHDDQDLSDDGYYDDVMMRNHLNAVDTNLDIFIVIII